jgi:glycosyl transferase family 87
LTGSDQRNGLVSGAPDASPGPASEPRRWIELAVWVAACLVHGLFWISLRTHWLVPLFNDTVHRFGPGADFFALYQAGYSAVHGHSIYSFLPGQTVIPYAYPFRYLPASAYTAGVLLTLVPPAAAYALWLGVCELCLLYNVRETYRRSGEGVRGALLAGLWLAFTPYFLELWVGQFTFLLGSLLFWSALALQDGRWKAAQGWWITSVLWKPASLLWAPLWLRERRFWPGLALCGLLLLGNLVYFLFFPGDWAVFQQANVQPLPTWHAGNIGLSGLLYHFTGEGRLFAPLRALLTLALAGPVLWVTFHRPRREDEGSGHQGEEHNAGRSGVPGTPWWLLAALWTLLYFLVYKDVWEHHLTLLLPFLVLGLWQAPSRLVAAVAVLLALPSPFVFYDMPGLGFNVDPQPYFSPAVSLLHHSWRVVPLLLLYGYWLRLAWVGEGAGSLEAPEHGEGQGVQSWERRERGSVRA